jgi:hypothetical protein
MKTVLAWRNVALLSITDAIPGVGGIYNEVKDGVEAAIDTVSDEPGAVKRVVRVLSPTASSTTSPSGASDRLS